MDDEEDEEDDEDEDDDDNDEDDDEDLRAGANHKRHLLQRETPRAMSEQLTESVYANQHAHQHRHRHRPNPNLCEDEGRAFAPNTHLSLHTHTTPHRRRQPVRSPRCPCLSASRRLLSVRSRSMARWGYRVSRIAYRVSCLVSRAMLEVWHRGSVASWYAVGGLWYRGIVGVSWGYRDHLEVPEEVSEIDVEEAPIRLHHDVA